ncbi:hypothetical protein [Chondromyces crocatus]|uniref:Uncharacterized protein n=1 Tax=Chondromyces crocatus TaxID=52 RepID=A0A0K1EI73_CHOCO|nr:hypothetical protein [Chondromyces crocatus]AKT40392.1 uncharacterized protein CMC5_045450 [Chondromyces crocatus]
MIPVRNSPETRVNRRVRELPPAPGEDNIAWLRRSGFTSGIVLLGGCDLVHFRLRVAQSHARQDLVPSYWSLVGILRRKGDDFSILSAPLDHPDASLVPRNNGVLEEPLARYANPERYPNIAAFTFPVRSSEIRRGIERVRGQRSATDLPDLIVQWLAFVWGAGRTPNPLLDQHGIPCAAFVTAAYGIAGLDLTPGLASTANCPEAIWQSARWWHPFYAAHLPLGDDMDAHGGDALEGDLGADDPAPLAGDGPPANGSLADSAPADDSPAEGDGPLDADTQAPRGAYGLRQRAAAVTWGIDT